jgi:hypothetical protein
MRKGHWHGDPELLGTPEGGPVGWMDGVALDDCMQCVIRRVHNRYRQPYIKENRFGGDMIEYGAISALFEDIIESEVGVTSGAQSAFDAARTFIKEMVENQCKLAGCLLAGQPYGVGNVHTEKCWFTKRAMFYEERNKRGKATEV